MEEEEEEEEREEVVGSQEAEDSLVFSTVYQQFLLHVHD